MVWKGLLPHDSDDNREVDEPASLALSFSTIVEELFLLLTVFQADRAAVGQFNKDMAVLSSRGDPLIDLRLAAIEPMVTKLLIGTAIKNRWRADALIKICGHSIGPWLVKVGRLFDNGEEQVLTLREGCNKIIHADQIEPQFLREGDLPPFLSGVVVMTGEKQGTSWKAELDVSNYVRASLFNTYGGIDFPRGWIRL